jgi:hypothetical protein
VQPAYQYPILESLIDIFSQMFPPPLATSAQQIYLHLRSVTGLDGFSGPILESKGLPGKGLIYSGFETDDHTGGVCD